MPWIVIIFGLAVGPLGAVSITLVILQPVLFNNWCTLCLASGLVSVSMIGPAMDELLASLQYLKRMHSQGRPVWRAFWGLERWSGASEQHEQPAEREETEQGSYSATSEPRSPSFQEN